MFINSQTEAIFNEKGFVKIPLLDDSNADELMELYEDTKDQSFVDKGFYTSIWSDNKSYRAKVNQGIKQILLPKLQNVFHGFDSLFANFMVKKAGSNTSLQPHQDWSFVDESKYKSITLWIPLDDVEYENGALMVCPYSHHMNNYVRPRFSDSPFSSDIDKVNENLMVPVPMKKGEALLINSRLIHASPDNNSNKDRIAVSIVLKPDNAQAVHYVKDRQNNDLIHKLNITPEFFVEYSCFDYPDINGADKLMFNNRGVDFDNLKTLITENRG